jgi:hypothetical protein
MLPPDLEAPLAGIPPIFIGLDGRIIKAHELDCPDDLSATDAARQFVDGHDVELWSFDRKVAHFDPVKPAGSTGPAIDP